LVVIMGAGVIIKPAAPNLVMPGPAFVFSHPGIFSA